MKHAFAFMKIMSSDRDENGQEMMLQFASEIQRIPNRVIHRKMCELLIHKWEHGFLEADELFNETLEIIRRSEYSRYATFVLAAIS